MKRIKKKLKRMWEWYVLGYYHCEHCPMCWAEYSYEGDGDCGCFVYGDIRDTCRLIPPLRQLIGWPRKRKAEYWAAHEWDGIDVTYQTEMHQDEALEKALIKAFDIYEFCMRDSKGHLVPPGYCKREIIENQVPNIRWEYEQAAHPYTYISLKSEWKKVLRRTWEEFLDIFRPYLPRKR